MKLMRFFSLVVLSLLVSGSVLALMPPLDPSELEQQSDVIVQGEVLEVKTVGKKDENGCRIDIPKEAKLRVDGWKKGKKTSPLTIRFKSTDFKDGCVGSPDHAHHKGESGVFYLRCGDDNVCALTHWNGVKKK